MQTSNAIGSKPAGHIPKAWHQPASIREGVGKGHTTSSDGTHGNPDTYVAMSTSAQIVDSTLITSAIKLPTDANLMLMELRDNANKNKTDKIAVDRTTIAKTAAVLQIAFKPYRKLIRIHPSKAP
jgi:hypothetical protein